MQVSGALLSASRRLGTGALQRPERLGTLLASGELLNPEHSNQRSASAMKDRKEEERRQKGVEQEIKGKTKRVKGKVDEVAGAVRGKTSQEVKGKVEKAAGKVQEKIGKRMQRDN
jgi:uncharacterized protein YjbJ (UPF0337 family)